MNRNGLFGGVPIGSYFNEPQVQYFDMGGHAHPHGGVINRRAARKALGNANLAAGKYDNIPSFVPSKHKDNDDRPKVDKDALASILSGGASSVSPVATPIYNPVMDDPYIVGDGEGDGLGTDAFGNTTYIGQQAPIERQNLISNVSPVAESIVKPFYKDGRLDRDQLPEGSAYQDVFDIGLNVYPLQKSPVGPLKYDIGFKPREELLAEINSRNPISFSPEDFENYITERKSYGEMDAAQESFLRDKYRENNTLAGTVGQAIENPGRENLNILPFSKPEDMTFPEARASGQVQFAVPQSLKDATTGIMRAIESPYDYATGRATIDKNNLMGSMGDAIGTAGLASVVTSPFKASGKIDADEGYNPVIFGDGGYDPTAPKTEEDIFQFLSRDINEARPGFLSIQGFDVGDLPVPKNVKEANARDLLELRSKGLGHLITDSLFEGADIKYLTQNLPLSLSNEARNARFEARGFPPNTTYHGSDKSNRQANSPESRTTDQRFTDGYRRFDPDFPEQKLVGSPISGPIEDFSPRTFSSDRRRVARTYAPKSGDAKARLDFDGIYKLRANEDNILNIDGNNRNWNRIKVSEMPEEVKESLVASGYKLDGYVTTDRIVEVADSLNYSGVNFKNIVDLADDVPDPQVYTLPDGKEQKGFSSTVRVRGPGGYKSVDAFMDPELAHLSNILAANKSTSAGLGSLAASKGFRTQEEINNMSVDEFVEYGKIKEFFRLKDSLINSGITENLEWSLDNIARRAGIERPD